MSRRADQYERLLAFYTPRWRAQNGRAALDTLRDEHALSGKSGPSGVDAFSFARAGIQERLFTPRTFSGSRITAVLVLLAAIGSAFYSIAVLWAPGADWPGHLGPFSNPAPIASALFIAAAGFAVARRDGAARLLSSAGGAVVLLLVALAVPNGWVGPGFPVSFAMVGLSLLSTRAVRRPAAAAAAVLLVGGPVALPFLHGLAVYLVQSTNWFAAVWVGCLTAEAVLLLALGWRWPDRGLEDQPSLSEVAVSGAQEARS